MTAHEHLHIKRQIVDMALYQISLQKNPLPTQNQPWSGAV